MLKSNASNRKLLTYAQHVTADFRQCFKLPNLGLRAYFGNVVKGQPLDYQVVTFAKGESTDSLLKGWDTVLKSIEDKWPTLYEYEMDLAKKVGPMSIMLPLDQRMADIDSYYEGVLLPSKPLAPRALAAVKSEWVGLRGLTPRSQAHTLEVMKKSTNSGSPYFTKKRTVVKRTVPCDVSWNGTSLKVYQNLPDFTGQACAILGWRGQEGGPSDEEVKQRVVWMFPFSVNLQELTVYQPLIESAQKSRLVPAWVSNDEVDRRITAMFDTKAPDDLVVCTDFSKFDQHFNFQLQSAAREILEYILESSSTSRKWLVDIFPIKYMIPLAYDWEQMRYGWHGMGSGSGGTNADETLAHRALQYEAAISHGAWLNPNSQCLGDDGVLTYPGITVDDVVAAYTSHGLEMNPDKQYASKDDCTYLRRWHHKDYRQDGVCVGVYSTMRTLGRLRYLERRPDPRVWSDSAIALRELSILENLKYHPLREEFVDYVIRKDSLRLGLGIPGFLDNIEGIARELIEEIPDFLGYNRSSMEEYNDPVGGITNWWIYNTLKSRR